MCLLVNVFPKVHMELYWVVKFYLEIGKTSTTKKTISHKVETGIMGEPRIIPNSSDSKTQYYIIKEEKII